MALEDGTIFGWGLNQFRDIEGGFEASSASGGPLLPPDSFFEEYSELVAIEQ